MPSPESLFQSIEQQQAALERLMRRQFDGGGGDGYDERMEARVAKLESTTEYIQRDIAELKGDMRELRKDLKDDFRILFGALIFIALGLAGIMAKGFHWL